MEIPEILVTKMANALLQERMSFWDLLLFNNSASVIQGLRKMGLTNRALPNAVTIVPILKRLVNRNEMKELSELATLFQFDAAKENATTNTKLWNAWGLKVGDVNGLFQKVYKTK